MGHMEEDRLEPIAVIGFSFKYPQDAISPDAFWEIMRQGRCVSSDFPADRLNADAFYHPDYSRHDSVCFELPSISQQQPEAKSSKLTSLSSFTSRVGIF